MKKKSLLETNPYLKDPAECETGIIRWVISSSAIEGVPPSAFGPFVTTRRNRTGKTITAHGRSTQSPRQNLLHRSVIPIKT